MPYNKSPEVVQNRKFYSFTLVLALRRKIKCVPKELQIAPAVDVTINRQRRHIADKVVFSQPQWKPSLPPSELMQAAIPFLSRHCRSGCC
jgi:hypothetical protein